MNNRIEQEFKPAPNKGLGVIRMKKQAAAIRAKCEEARQQRLKGSLYVYAELYGEDEDYKAEYQRRLAVARQSPEEYAMVRGKDNIYWQAINERTEAKIKSGGKKEKRRAFYR